MLPDKEIDNVKEQLYSEGANVKKIYSTAAYNNLDIYQVNTTYYSALGNNDNAYLLARAIQFLHLEYHRYTMLECLPVKMI